MKIINRQKEKEKNMNKNYRIKKFNTDNNKLMKLERYKSRNKYWVKIKIYNKKIIISLFIINKKTKKCKNSMLTMQKIIQGNKFNLIKLIKTLILKLNK